MKKAIKSEKGYTGKLLRRKREQISTEEKIRKLEAKIAELKKKLMQMQADNIIKK